MEEKHGLSISEQDYHVFVEPFEGMNRLEALHASLKPEEIVEPAKTSTIETNVVDFPENLSFSKNETAAFKAVHGLLTSLQCSSLGLRDPDTFSQHHKLENRKAHVFRFLWMLGRYGKFEREDSIPYDRRKNLSC
jgi:hypothetical protein